MAKYNIGFDVEIWLINIQFCFGIQVRKGDRTNVH